MGRWSDLVMTIKEKLVSYGDKVRVRAVCSSLNSILPNMPKHPCLLYEVYDNDREASHGLFNPFDNKFYPLDLPMEQGKFFKGSSNGWVLTVDDIDAIQLTNLVTRSQTEFPPIKKYDEPDVFYNYFAIPHVAKLFDRTSIHKIIWSSAPWSDDCVAVAIYAPDLRLAYWRFNDEKPTLLFNRQLTFDIIFYNGKLYAVGLRGKLIAFKNLNRNAKFTQVAPKVSDTTANCFYYLVESSDGGLMMVEQELRDTREVERKLISLENINHKTYGFRVYKHDPKKKRWIRVNNIGDEIIFVGHCSSMSISCIGYPGFKGNRIYFTEEVCKSSNDRSRMHIGVFNLDEETIEAVSPVFECDQMKRWPPPIWVTANLH